MIVTASVSIETAARLGVVCRQGQETQEWERAMVEGGGGRERQETEQRCKNISAGERDPQIILIIWRFLAQCYCKTFCARNL